jgi:hypothetical protein
MPDRTLIWEAMDVKDRALAFLQAGNHEAARVEFGLMRWLIDEYHRLGRAAG